MSQQLSYEDLKPTGPERRFFGFGTYALMWVSSVVIIAWWLMGEGAVPPIGPLNWYQAVIAAIIAHIIMSIGVGFNGRAGVVQGIPYVIQSRSSFGFIGSKIPNVIRALPAICWFGIESWLGALAFMAGIRIVTGVSYGFTGILICFLIFQAVQVVLTMRGIKLLKTFVSYVAIYLIPCWVIIGVQIYREVGFGLAESWMIEGSWGLPFWFIITAFLGILTTGMLNASDYSRYYPQGKTGSYIVSSLLGIAPAGILLVILGMLGGAGTGIYDPIEIMITRVPSLAVLVPMLIFIALAQWGTNISLNIVPPANVLMDIFSKLDWKKAVIITGILGTLTFPWWLMSAGVFMWFMVIYSAFLGPIFGILMVDYYVIWKQKPNVSNLYEVGNPDIHYDGGWNLAGMIALAIGIGCSFIIKEISWFLGTPAGALAYYILIKVWYQKKHPNIGRVSATGS